MMGDVRSVKEVADYVRGLLPNADITLLPGITLRESFRYDAKPIEEELGYRPQWSLEQGIKETINITRREHGLPPV